MSSSSYDFYKILGVPKSATQEQIRAAYYALVKRYHPDQHHGHPLADLASEQMARINHAYAVLGDPAKRRAYDARAMPTQTRGKSWSWLAVGGACLFAFLLLRRLILPLLGLLRGTPVGLIVVLVVLGLVVYLWRRHKK